MTFEGCRAAKGRQLSTKIGIPTFKILFKNKDDRVRLQSREATEREEWRVGKVLPGEFVDEHVVENYSNLVVSETKYTKLVSKVAKRTKTREKIIAAGKSISEAE